jgi:hypothetical protein
VPIAQQVTHSVTLFATDNNGMALQLAPLSSPAATVSGYMTFGIGTQTNNGLGGATVFTVDADDNFTTRLLDTGQSLTSSFIDSGSDGFFFPDGSVPVCATPDSSFFCPTSRIPFSTVNIGANNAQSTINFNVDNADSLFSTYPTGAAFNTLAGPNGTGACSNGAGACSFDWGLPFFYGRSIFAAIRGQSQPLGAPAAPWWAYTTGFSGQ